MICMISIDKMNKIKTYYELTCLMQNYYKSCQYKSSIILSSKVHQSVTLYSKNILANIDRFK